jgi:uncharacterized membrane protein YkoI
MRKISGIALLLVLTIGVSASASDKKESKKALAKEAKVTMKEARVTALQAAPGKIKEGELEREDGKLIYSFDIKTKEGIKEVQIDAIDGKVVSVKTETAEDEAKEKAAEKKAKKP